jgi:hypothetical protein
MIDRPLSIREIHERLLTHNFRWTERAVEAVLTREVILRDFFQCEKGGFLLRKTTSS